MVSRRIYPIGAEVRSSGVHFRVWAPDHKKVNLVLEDSKDVLPMKREKNGYFSLFTKKAQKDGLYRYQLSGSETFYADPASRYQPSGPFGPSCIVDPNFAWTDQKWKGPRAHGQVAYEMHIGTFTQKGTYAAAMAEMPRLVDLGITLIELLPLNDFPGHFGWGYDGVNLFAPTHLYGTPKELKAFINKAHHLGLAVVLDVVYNHLGPEGNQMVSFAKEYHTDKFITNWGKAINFDNLEARRFFLTNVTYWIEEYHFDGLRIDATHAMFCSTKEHILKEITRTIKAAGGKRKTLSIAENEPQNSLLLRPYEEGGYGFDMLWNDDFHHTAMVRLTGKREAYYADYLGSPQEFISSLKYGFLFQGQYYVWQKKARGTPHFSIPPQAMMIFLENHDQIANSGHGKRLHQKADPGNYRAMTALFLLSPNTPLIFQGQEFNSKQPFNFFADHAPELSQIIKKGRKEELAQFPRLATHEVRKSLPGPENPLTFTECKLTAKDRDAKMLALLGDLIHLRKSDPVFKKMHTLKIDGAVLGPDVFLLRYFGEEEGDRLILINFGPDFHFNPAPEPLLALGSDEEFNVIWSSESCTYGGEGTSPIRVPFLKILGHSALVLGTKRKLA